MRSTRLSRRHAGAANAQVRDTTVVDSARVLPLPGLLVTGARAPLLAAHEQRHQVAAAGLRPVLEIAGPQGKLRPWIEWLRAAEMRH